MKDVKKIDFDRTAQKEAGGQRLLFPVLAMPQPVFACSKPIAPFKVKTGA